MNALLCRCLKLASVLALLVPLAAPAEDIDLYAGTTSNASAPNVLFFLDNSSNWSANSQAWAVADVTAKCNAYAEPKRSVCLGYVANVFGSDSSLKQGQVELRALRLVLNDLVCKTGAKLKANVGLMLFNPTGTPDSSSGISGYIRQRVTSLDATQCSVLLNDLSNIDAKITSPDFKGPSAAEYGAPLYEAFKYFGGFTNPAGARSATAGTPADATHFGPVRYGNKTALEDPLAFQDSGRTTYQSPIASDFGCGKNFIVLVGNTWPNQEYGSNTNAAPNPTNLLLTRLAYDPGAQIYPKPLAGADKTDVRFADEWAKFLYATDVSDVPGVQRVSMFTIDVYNKSPSAKQSQLLQSMADQAGEGNYHSVGGDLYALVDALASVLVQVGAVNNVFAAASLPVSVNAQGTFLNQVFMGVFRPDGDAQQRWTGNLKQYRFGLSGSTLYLADANGNPAVDTVNTGFILDCASSFWSSANSYWQTITKAPLSECPSAPNGGYSDAPDGPMVERGAAGQRLRALGHANRNIRTCKDASCKLSGAYALVDLDAASVSGLDATLLAWARGENTNDGLLSVAGTQSWTGYGQAADATRPTVHGEVVHSRPLAVNYGIGGANDVVVFYGAGDGMLRAVDGNQSGAGAGNELWAFLAPEHWNTLDRVRTNSPLISYPSVLTGVTPTPQPKSYFFDGSIGGYQERTATSVDKMWIYPSMRRGGRMVYGFDVTARPGKITQPSLMWKFGCSDSGCATGASGESNIGQTWSTPVLVRVEGRSTPLAVFGAGYDTCEDADDADVACAAITRGRGVYVMNGQSGPGVAADYHYFPLDSTAGRFVADMAAVDVNGDGYTDAIYAADTRGNLWRFNTSDPANGFKGYAKPSDWPVQKIAIVAAWAGDAGERRKFMYSPSVVVLGTQTTVLLGTGDREKPSSSSPAAQVKNRFYGFFDNVTVTSGVTPVVGYGTADLLMDVTGLSNDSITPSALASYKGWFMNLSTTAAPYEQVVTTPLTIAGVTYFSTFQAKDVKGSATCLGTARAYQVDFQTGTKLPGLSLVTDFISEGIPPSPVGGVVSIDGKTVPFLIGGPGTSPLSPTKIVPKVKPNRKPVYRYQRIDRTI
jgi:type IV pilus assembly protein PilY1